MPIVLPVQDPCYFCEIIHGRADRWNVVAEDASTPIEPGQLTVRIDIQGEYELE